MAASSSHQLPMYDMKRNPSGKRGICLIINNFQQKGGDNDKLRAGAADKANLLRTFANLDFDVDGKYYWEDLESTQMKAKLEVVATEGKHSSYDCFVCCINSHGNDIGVLGVDKEPVKISELTSHFRATNCEALAGKPKLFFIDACRGALHQRAAKTLEEGHEPSMTIDQSRSIPDENDFLMVCATPHGYTAYEHEEPSNGSRFFTSLTKHLDSYAKTHDILEIMTMVNKDVSAQTTPIQTPTPMFTLCKKLYLGERKVRVPIAGPSSPGNRTLTNAIMKENDGGEEETATHQQTDCLFIPRNNRIEKGG